MSPARQLYRDLIALIRLGRPYFLAGGFVMHALGVCAALHAGASLNWPALLLGQVAITSTQWMVHYANEYFDLSADRLNTSSTVWSGGSRVLANGELRPHLAHRVAIAFALIAIAAAVALVLVAGRGTLAAVLIGVTLLLSWGYSAPPFRWQARGFGPLVTALIVAILTPGLGFYLQAGYIPGWLLLALWVPFCLQVCFLICIDFPDAAADAAAGKRTLVVRDPAASKTVYMVSLSAAYFAAPLMLLAGLPGKVVFASLLGTPLAIWLFVRAKRGCLTEPKCWVVNEWVNVALVMLTAAAEAVAFGLSQG